MMKTLYQKGVKSIKLSRLIPAINSDRIIDESNEFRRNSGIPFLRTKGYNGDIPEKDSFFTIDQKKILVLDKCFFNLHDRIIKLGKEGKSLKEDLDSGKISAVKYDRELPYLKRQLAENISEMTNIIHEHAEGLFCGMAVSDVFSSVVSNMAF